MAKNNSSSGNESPPSSPGLEVTPLEPAPHRAAAIEAAGALGELGELNPGTQPNFAVGKAKVEGVSRALKSCTQPLQPASPLYKFPDFPLVQG